MSGNIIPLKETDKEDKAIVGGKGANLGILVNLGIKIPEGFCITTNVFNNYMEELKLEKYFTQLDNLETCDTDKINKICYKIRNIIMDNTMNKEIINKIMEHIQKIDMNAGYAVRSSATLEDSSFNSFAGQHETYLNVKGKQNIINKVKSCWASLYSPRAVTYRINNNISHLKVAMAVVIQKMIFSEKSGILFTADPVTNNRNIVTIEASYGLGEALVSGLVTPDTYKVSHQNLIIYRKAG
ncbi:MAG: PEP/pyruvate-binding domain-containing protein, partial [bacterium]